MGISEPSPAEDDAHAWSPRATRLLRHEARRRIGSRPSVQHAAVLVSYCLLSLGLFGPKVVHDFGSRFIAKLPWDASIFMWSLRWWPYALAHHLNPLYTKLVWAPGGINLAWTTTPPIPSLLLAPITLWFGPVAAFNVMTLLGPAVSAWTAYLLCRRVTHAPLASIIGGLSFGFSVAVLFQLGQGHPNFFLAPMVPLAAYWVVRYLERSLSARAFVVLLGVTIFVQFGISTEVTATMTFFGAVAWVLGFAFADRAWRVRLARVAGFTAMAYAGVVILLTPWLYVAFRYPRPLLSVPQGTSLARFAHHWTTLSAAVLPGNTILGGSIWPLQTSRSGNALYLGVPLLLILIHLLVTQWRNPAVRALAITFVLIFASSFGSGLIIGRHILPTPFPLLHFLPVLKLALPNRLISYFALIAAVGVAAWLALGRREWWRWAVAGVAVVTALPNLGVTPVVATVPSSPFFSTGEYRTVLSPGEEILIDEPVRGWEGRVRLGYMMLWQAKSGMYFALAGGFFGTASPASADARMIRSINMNTYYRNDLTTINALIRRLGVTSILAIDQPPGAIQRLCRLLATPPVTIDGVVLFRGPFGTPYKAKGSSSDGTGCSVAMRGTRGISSASTTRNR